MTPAQQPEQPSSSLACVNYCEMRDCCKGEAERYARTATLKTLDKEITALSNQIGALRNLEPEFGSENEIEIRVLSRWKLRLQESLRQQAGEQE